MTTYIKTMRELFDAFIPFSNHWRSSVPELKQADTARARMPLPAATEASAAPPLCRLAAFRLPPFRTVTWTALNRLNKLNSIIVGFEEVRAKGEGENKNCVLDAMGTENLTLRMLLRRILPFRPFDRLQPCPGTPRCSSFK